MPRMKYREQRTMCGEYIFVNVYPYCETISKQHKRKKKRVSKKSMDKVNRKNRENEVNKTICANFTDEDYYLTLSYKIECMSKEQAAKDFRNFIDKINRLRKKRGLAPCKWIKVIEVGKRNGRIHIHAIISGGLTPSELAHLWGNGYIDTKPLTFDNCGCKKLAAYLVKQATEEEPKSDSELTKVHTWSCSRNCTRPKPKTNDNKYSKRKVKEIADSAREDNRRSLDHLFEGYECTSAKSYYQDEFGLEYVYLIYRRKEEPKKAAQKPKRRISNSLKAEV